MNKKNSSIPKLKQNKKRYLAALIFAICIVILAITLYFARFIKSPNNSSLNKPSQETNATDTPINLNPPTNQDKQAVDQTKKNIAENQNQSSSMDNQGRIKVSPLITSVDSTSDNQVRVYGSISGIVEDNGSCTFIFTKDSSTLTKVTNAVADATTTRCIPLSFAKSELENGPWNVNLTYLSQKATGGSDNVSFEVN